MILSTVHNMQNMQRLKVANSLFTRHKQISSGFTGRTSDFLLKIKSYN